MIEWLRHLFVSRYVRFLEEENARLREENRALMNSLLGVAGHAPVDFSKAPVSAVRPRPRLSWHQLQRMTERQSEETIIERARRLREQGKTRPAAGQTPGPGEAA
jgi:hypothetical protein